MAEEEVIDLYSMKVTELKEQLKARSLPVSGPKATLIERLEKYMQEHEGVEVVEEEEYQKKKEESILSEKAPSEEDKLVNSISLNDEELEATVNSVAADVKPNVEADQLKTMTEEERKAKRASRFPGVENANLDDNTVGGGVGVDLDKIKSRAERFGLSADEVSNLSKKAEQDAAIKRRQERFGTVETTVSAKKQARTEMQEKKAARAERFGMGNKNRGGIGKMEIDSDKVAARKARFGAV